MSLSRYLRSRRGEGEGCSFILMIVCLLIMLVVIVFTIDYAIMGWHWIVSQNVQDSAVTQWAVDSSDEIETARVFESFRANPEEDLGCFPADKAGFHLLINDTDDLWLCCNGEMHGSVDCHEVSRPALF